MLGAVLMVVVMVLVVPVAIMFGGAIWSALFGWVSSDDADRRHQYEHYVQDAFHHSPLKDAGRARPA